MQKQKVAWERRDEGEEQVENLSQMLGNVSRFSKKAKSEGGIVVEESVLEKQKMSKRRRIAEEKKKKAKKESRENCLICCSVFCVFIAIIGVVVGYLTIGKKI